MGASQKPRFILVSRKTRLQELTERFNTWPQAKFYLEHNQVDAVDYLREHDVYVQQLLEAERILKGQGRFQLLERGYLPDYQFSPEDIVVVVGQDGLVANTLKYLQGQPVIAVNPDPQRWEGRLLPFVLAQLPDVVQRTRDGRSESKSITFAEARTNDGQRLLGVNDLFIGPKSHTSARYALQWHGHEEEQSSSGIIVSTGFGSSGWFKSDSRRRDWGNRPAEPSACERIRMAGEETLLYGSRTFSQPYQWRPIGVRRNRGRRLPAPGVAHAGEWRGVF